MHTFPNIEIHIGISHSCSQKTRNKVAFICDYLTSNNPEADGRVVPINEGDKKFNNDMWYIVSEQGKDVHITDISSELSVKLRDKRRIELALYGLIAPFFFENVAGPIPLAFIKNLNVMNSYMFHYSSLESLQKSLSTIKIRDFCSMSCSIELPINAFNMADWDEGIDAVKKYFKIDETVYATYCSPSGLNCKRHKSPRLILTLISSI